MASYSSECEEDHSMSESVSGEGDVMGRLPARLFATDRYPLDGRINSYSKLQYLIDIVDILHGTKDYDFIMRSSLGCLFKLPVYQCSLNGKLVHNIVCRQVLLENDDDIWFTFGGHPLRFSLSEFEVVTGLNCGSFPSSDVLSRAQFCANLKKPYLHRLTGRTGNVSIGEIVGMLKNEPDMPRWRKIRLVLLVIVEGILVCGTQPVCVSVSIAEMLKDMDFFLSYPWGRRSFDMTIRMMKIGARVETSEELVGKLRKSSMVLHGFPIALQLFLFRQIPALLSYVPNGDDLSTFVDRRVGYLPTLKTFHTGNILKVENSPELIVLPVALARESSGMPSVGTDPCIKYLEELIRKGYKFSKSDWEGGYASLPQLCTCGRERHGICSCLERRHVPSGQGGQSFGDNNGSSELSCRCTKLLPMFKQLQVDHKVGMDNISESLDKKLELFRVNLVSEVSGVLENVKSLLACKCNVRVVGDVVGSAPPVVQPDIQDSGDCATRRSVASQGGAACRVVDKALDNYISRHCQGKMVDNKSGVPCISGCVPEVRVQDMASSSATTDAVPSKKRRKCVVLRGAELGVSAAENKDITAADAEVEVGSENCVQLYASTSGFCPFPRSSPALVAKFRSRLRDFGTREVVVDGEEVMPRFLCQIAKPQQWLNNLQLDAMISAIWRERCSFLMEAKIALTDCYFMQFICRNFKAFQKSSPDKFAWPVILERYVRGHIPDRVEICPWLRDVETVYAPMNWGDRHWVALVINFRTWHVDILDPFIAATRARKVPGLMAPILEMLPHLLAASCLDDTLLPRPLRPFTHSVVQGVSQNERTGDCGALAVKFIELHSHGQRLTGITEEMVTEMRFEYALKVLSRSGGPNR